MSPDDGRPHSPTLHMTRYFLAKACSSLLSSLACLPVLLQDASRLGIDWGSISESVSSLVKPGWGPGTGLRAREGAVATEYEISEASKVHSSCHSLTVVCLLLRLPHWTRSP